MRGALDFKLASRVYIEVLGLRLHLLAVAVFDLVDFEALDRTVDWSRGAKDVFKVFLIGLALVYGDLYELRAANYSHFSICRILVVCQGMILTVYLHLDIERELLDVVRGVCYNF